MSLLSYCQARHWSGHDPYDALNSGLLAAIPGADRPFPRLALTQLLKRSPLDFRRLLAIPPTQNPKALALMLRAVLKLQRAGHLDGDGLVRYFIERIAALRSSESNRYWCWGYSFPWQTRTRLVPRGAPNLVCTTFVANALLDAWEAGGSEHLLDMAASAASYIANELYFEDAAGVASFAYPCPDTKNRIHNANLLASALLLRVHAQRPDGTLPARALAAARFSAACQRADGAWYYGEASSQRWIDNFHTAYNLEALRSIERMLGTAEFQARIRTGFSFYSAHFVSPDGVPRYFHDRTYPIDIHCVAQAILTFLEFADLDATAAARAQQICDWAIRHMWDERGYFYYRVLRFGKNRISYMRWSQAWMLLALATLCTS